MKTAWQSFPPNGMTVNNAKPRQWEIWHARFDFNDRKGYKYRPVIIVETYADGTLAMMVTSSTNKLSLPHDYLLADWREAGLEKPSLARVDRRVILPEGYFGRAGRIGRLSLRDIGALEAILNTLDAA